MTDLRPIQKIISYLWAILPLLSFGLATPLVHVHAAVRLRSAWQWAAALFYVVAVVGGIGIADPEGGPVAETVFTTAFLVSALGGTAHALAIRRRVFAPAGGEASTRTALDQAIEASRARNAVREQAREVAMSDPVMARELRIGRPDLSRSYDDGGLVDVNNCPAPVLLTLPGMSPELVDRVIRARERCGAFVSAEEVMALADLPPQLLPHLKEYTVYVQ